MSKELRFLQGPQSRRFEFDNALRVVAEYYRGLRALHFVGPCVTVFGSARITQNDPYYALARRTGALLAEAGFTVMTGGGPGTATESLTLNAYNEWRALNLGGSAALSYVLLIIVTFVAVMFVNTVRQKILERL